MKGCGASEFFFGIQISPIWFLGFANLVDFDLFRAVDFHLIPSRGKPGGCEDRYAEHRGQLTEEQAVRLAQTERECITLIGMDGGYRDESNLFNLHNWLKYEIKSMFWFQMSNPTPRAIYMVWDLADLPSLISEYFCF